MTGAPEVTDLAAMPRIWERSAERGTDESLTLPLRFKVVPGVWPDIELRDPDWTTADVSAIAHEIRVRVEPAVSGSFELCLGSFRLSIEGGRLSAPGHSAEVPAPGPVTLVVYVSGRDVMLALDGEEPVHLVSPLVEASTAVVAVTENVAEFTIAQRPPATAWIRAGGGTIVLDARVFGLREQQSLLHATASPVAEPGREFYTGGSFTVFDHQVVDLGGATPAALIPDRRTIVSPIRVVEEFSWRDNPRGDMTRVADRTELWRSALEPGRFPVLESGFASVDAAFELALETFQRNSSGEFSLPGQTGSWSAGYFQGPGQGFGSWRRDTSHIALRSGNLIDARVARASLANVATAGFDNGSDGDSLPAVAIWDHVLATGDESLALETWDDLVGSAAALDGRFDPTRRLVRAAQSTSNDLFDEPEAGGYALSTEIYSMQTYQALARLGELPIIGDRRAAQWQARAQDMRSAIVNQYWNPAFGFFTSGPVGTESYERGLWETSGSEASVWGFLGIEAEPRIASVLRAAREVAMSDYGLVLFPYREPEDHFSGTVWYCWQAGFARAAARHGDAAFIHQLVGQQARAVVLNKTFYEVTEREGGASWRWPGQLWHAAGYVSLILLGVLGLSYDQDGLTFTPAVVPRFDGMRLLGFRYRNAILDIEVRGSGTRCSVALDGRPVQRISADTVGPHTVSLTMSN